MRVLHDLELLQIEMDLLWGSHGPELVIACARDGLCARISSTVPEHVARKLLVEVQSRQPSDGFGSPPRGLERWRTALEDALGAAISLTPRSGPSYLIEDNLVCPATARLVRSDAAEVSELSGANPGNWRADEWVDLLEGRLGPWVMAIQGSRVTSICHTPVSNGRAAEAGVWTHPEFRGRGHAAATTAEWAALLRPTGRFLFYSTSSTNYSSQALAARLHLRPIGWLWQLNRRNAESGWTDARVRSGPSPIEGSGLYTAALIRAGEVVFVWCGGRIITNAGLGVIAASGKRYSSAAIGEDQNLLWDVVDVDAGGPGGANHSCDPNLWMQDERTVCARRDIAAGEELTLDYALATVSPEWRMECHCGAAACRGVVSGNDWQLPELQRRYAGHFSPFINARIASRRGAG
jgi:RimJ/RimL family protein N-acetyltransferase